MTVDRYLELKDILRVTGYGHEFDWAQTVQPVSDAQTFWEEFAWVVLNSGMKNQVAQGIWRRVKPVVESGGDISTVFGHKGKREAIVHVYQNKEALLAAYLASEDKLAFIESLPWIGPITKYHLAKNYGLDFAKPDRHLVRIAADCGKTTEQLCQELATITGDRIGAVDVVIWRAANQGYA